VLYAVFSYVFIIANVLLIYVTAKLLIGMLFLVAPIFIAFLLFKRTQEYFNKWLNTIISFALQQIFVIFCLNMFNMLIYYIFKLVLGFKICWDSVWQVNLGVISFTILEFWTPYANPSAPKLGKDPNLYQPEANVPSLVSILLLWIIVKIMKDFIPKVADLANSLAEGVDSAARYTQSIASNLEKLQQHPFALARKAFDATAGAIGYKNASSRLLSLGSEKLLNNVVGIYSERQKQEFIKKEERMRKDKAEIMKVGDDAVAGYKKANLADFANGNKTEKNLKDERKRAMKEKLEDMMLERTVGTEYFKKTQAKGIKNALEFAKDKNLSAKELDELKKVFIRGEINNLKQQTVINYDFSLNEKGKLSSEYFAKHDSVAGFAFSLAKERFEKGGTLTSTLLEKAEAKKEDAKVSRIDAKNAGIDQKSRNIRQNTWKDGKTWKESVFNTVKAPNTWKESIIDTAVDYTANVIHSGWQKGEGTLLNTAKYVLNMPLKSSSAVYQGLIEKTNNKVLAAGAAGVVGLASTVAAVATVGVGGVGVGAVVAVGIGVAATAGAVVAPFAITGAIASRMVFGSIESARAIRDSSRAILDASKRRDFASLVPVKEIVDSGFADDLDVADGPIANAPSAYDIPYIGGTRPTEEGSPYIGGTSPTEEGSPYIGSTRPTAEIDTGVVE
jgi:hypothetical protein